MKKLRTLKALSSFAICCGVIASSFATPALACTQVKDWISVCTEGSQWEAVVDGDGDTLFRNTENFQGQLLVYKGGTADGLEIEDAAQTAVNSDTKSSQDYKILGRGKMASGNIIFTSSAKRADVDYIYTTTLSMGAKETLRIVTWRRGVEASDADRRAHLAFGKLIKLEGPR